ncbi:hypothetical protein [uncultured Sphingomonas sp.]|uniref:hypothetical protein n=1 Tax=uncultured Sphingomonas sp. TaxID=158754 RepID=UPI0035C9B10A
MGNAGVNTLITHGGNDVLQGRGGDDAYLVFTGDAVIETQGGGYDTVYAIGDYVLTAGAMVEVLPSYDPDGFVAQNLTGHAADTIILPQPRAST